MLYVWMALQVEKLHGKKKGKSIDLILSFMLNYYNLKEPRNWIILKRRFA
jgi:hypothetical protein